MTTRVALDTNIWRYVSDASGFDLTKILKDSGVTAYIPVSVAQECLFIDDADLRSRVFSLILRRTNILGGDAWTNMTRDVVNGFAFANPDIPHMFDRVVMTCLENKFYNTPKHFVFKNRKNFWSLCKFSPDLQRNNIDVSDLNQERSKALKFRRETTGNTFKIAAGGLFDKSVEFRVQMLPELNDSAASQKFFVTRDKWRAFSYSLFSKWLTDRSKGFSHLIRHDNKILGIVMDNWNRFWMEKADIDNMPVVYVIYAMHLLAKTKKVTDGSPQDFHLSQCLPNVDYLITSDRSLFSALQSIYQQRRKIRIGRPLLTSPCVDDIAATIKSCRE